MLSRKHAIYVCEGGVVRPDRLSRVRHRAYLGYARRLLALYAEGEGRTRGELHREVARVLAADPDCPRRRRASFECLLDGASEFAQDRRGDAARVRLQVYELAAQAHPVTAATRDSVTARIALALGRDWNQVRRAMSADRRSEQRLLRFHGRQDPEAFLARYNVAQVQVALFDASELDLRLRTDFKRVIQLIKLAGVLHEIERSSGGYRITVAGPASLLRRTTSYGARLARLIPALLACRGWAFAARIHTPNGPATLSLRPEDGLHGTAARPAEFDSMVEQRFAQSFGAEQAGWSLQREAAILHVGQKVFLPDFSFRHRDGTEIHMEIVGFWTPDYLLGKYATLSRFAHERLLVALPAPRRERPPDCPPGVVLFRRGLDPGAVLAALERLRRERPGPG